MEGAGIGADVVIIAYLGTRLSGGSLDSESESAREQALRGTETQE